MKKNSALFFSLLVMVSVGTCRYVHAHEFTREDAALYAGLIGSVAGLRALLSDYNKRAHPGKSIAVAGGLAFIGTPGTIVSCVMIKKLLGQLGNTGSLHSDFIQQHGLATLPFCGMSLYAYVEGIRTGYQVVKMHRRIMDEFTSAYDRKDYRIMQRHIEENGHLANTMLESVDYESPLFLAVAKRSLSPDGDERDTNMFYWLLGNDGCNIARADSQKRTIAHMIGNLMPTTAHIIINRLRCKDLNQEDSAGKTPLHYLIDDDKKFPDEYDATTNIMKMMLDKGANIHAVREYLKEQGSLQLKKWCKAHVMKKIVGEYVAIVQKSISRNVPGDIIVHTAEYLVGTIDAKEPWSRYLHLDESIKKDQKQKKADALLRAKKPGLFLSLLQRKTTDCLALS